MFRAAFRLRHMVVLACLVIGMDMAGPARAAGDDTHAWSVILDPQQPLAARRQALAALEQHAPDDGQGELYLLGSLYRMGPEASGAPVPQDLEKATLYSGNV